MIYSELLVTDHRAKKYAKSSPTEMKSHRKKTKKFFFCGVFPPVADGLIYTFNLYPVIAYNLYALYFTLFPPKRPR